MAASGKHRGWLLGHNNGVLAAVYNGVMPGTTALGANTALEGVLAGTPVAAASPVDSLFISNTVANGDIVLFTLLGGSNSTEVLRVDTSAGDVILNEASADWNFRVETDGIAYAIYSDGGKNALVLGSNTDTSSADQLITVSRAARTATAATNFFDLAMAPAGAVTIPAGTTAVVAEVSITEPNITATGTVTNATTLYIASQPTEGGTTNSAIFFGAAANIAATTSLTFNDDSADIDFRFETNNLAYAIYADGGKDALVLGSNTDTSSADQLITVSRPARTSTANVNYYDLAIAPAAAVTVPAGTTAIVASVNIDEPNITATGTVTNACTVRISGAPTEGGTGNYAFWVDAGVSRFDGNLDFQSAAADLVAKANTTAALRKTDGTTALYVLDTRNTVTVQNHLFDAPASQTLPNAATSQFRNVSIAAHTVTLAGTTQVTTLNNGASLWVGAPTYNQSGGAVTVDQLSTLHVSTPVAGASVTVTANRVISTDDVACYLSTAYVWTDKPSTRTVKTEIQPLDFAKMPELLETIQPVSFKYDPARLGMTDFGRDRYGIIAEELPEFLRAPGDQNPQAMSGTLLGAFGLAGLRYLHETGKALAERLSALEAKMAPGASGI